MLTETAGFGHCTVYTVLIRHVCGHALAAYWVCSESNCLLLSFVLVRLHRYGAVDLSSVTERLYVLLTPCQSYHCSSNVKCNNTNYHL